MLDRIESPETVLAFRAVGTIDRLDYERVLRPAVAEMVAKQGEARFVYELGPEYEHYAVAAAWEDLKLGVRHWSKWKRIALVTDRHGLQRATRVIGWLVPGEVKAFPLAEEEAAFDWAAA
jgi:hypothetical protein